MKLLALSLIFFNTIQFSFGYVISRSDAGKKVRWQKSSKTIKLYVDSNPISTTGFEVDTTNNLGLGPEEYISLKTRDIIEESVAQWNSVSPYEFELIYTDSIPFQFNDINYVAYSNNFNYFTSSTIAVTSSQLNPFTGIISSFGILINQSFRRPNVKYTLDKSLSGSSYAYLGDVMTHELGHALGLGHSEAVDSTMVFSIFKDQHTISEDDIAGINSNYNISKNGALKGQAVTGNQVPIFGANVTVISALNNKIVQSQLTDEEGYFYFDGLDFNDSYYIQVSPVENTSYLPDYYQNINHNLCNRKSFKPTFFQKCGPRSKGRPQIFSLNESEDYIDAGIVSIKCDENLNTNYYLMKLDSDVNEVELSEDYRATHSIINGSFSLEEITQGTGGKGDRFILDLTGINPQDFSLSSLVNRVSLASTAIASALEFQVYVKRDDQATWSYYTSTIQASTEKILTDIQFDLSLSSVSSNNKFEVIIYPKELNYTKLLEIFSSPELLNYDEGQYILSSVVGHNSSGKFVPINEFSSYPYEDNLSCLDGDSVRTTGAYTPLSSLSNASQLEDDGLQVSCASVDIGGGSGGGGPLSFLLGFILLFALSQLTNNKHISLSKF